MDVVSKAFHAFINFFAGDDVRSLILKSQAVGIINPALTSLVLDAGR